MSRIIKSIIDSVIGTDNTQYVFFHYNQKIDIDIAKLIGGKCLTFNKNTLDVNNTFKVIQDTQLGNDLSICPRYIVNTSIINYHACKNLSELLRIPIFNIINDVEGCKLEGLFSMANVIDQDINILLNKTLADKLFLSNYTVIDKIEQIPNIIKEKLTTWKLI